ncbi:hypothetical protein DB30_06113 [Enhygromyxa salina]|uniref:Uncharacterized protein n=2 Tax=Enhygromyxa salina TaxID=215803 RepID=A0A0C2CVE9_9BACT|nr:hypothetical protein DB30_06113 [Enhygromyxa salina]
MKVGEEFHHGASPTVGAITLAPGLERLSTVSFADGWVFISAREGADLVVLLANEGVITDDVTMPGFAEHLVVADCDTTADTFLAVLAPDGCTDTNAPRSVRGFTHDGRRLVDVPDPVMCWCDLVEP